MLFLLTRPPPELIMVKGVFLSHHRYAKANNTLLRKANLPCRYKQRDQIDKKEYYSWLDWKIWNAAH